MTAIAYRSGILAADTLESDDSMKYQYQSRKVFKLRDGRLFGAAGGSEGTEILYRSLVKGTPLPRLADVEAILVNVDGSVLLYEGAIWTKYKHEYHALGSGRIAALAAMYNKAGAIQAVKTAIQLDPHCGGRVLHVKLKGKK